MFPHGLHLRHTQAENGGDVSKPEDVLVSALEKIREGTCECSDDISNHRHAMSPTICERTIAANALRDYHAALWAPASGPCPCGDECAEFKPDPSEPVQREARNAFEMAAEIARTRLGAALMARIEEAILAERADADRRVKGARREGRIDGLRRAWSIAKYRVDIGNTAASVRDEIRVARETLESERDEPPRDQPALLDETDEGLVSGVATAFANKDAECERAGHGVPSWRELAVVALAYLRERAGRK